MVVQIVQFQLAGISPDEYEALAERIAPAFTDLPGLIAKVWVADDTEDTYGGVYLWTDRAAAEAYADGELLAGARQNPAFVNFRSSILARFLRPPRSQHRTLQAFPRRSCFPRVRGVGSTLGALLDRQAARLVGRERERAALLRLVREDVPVAVFVYGLAGVGKSTLVAAFAADAREHAATVLSMDGRTIEPTERGFLDALAARLGCEPGPPAEVVAAFGAQATRTVLAIDHYEALTLIDDWIRQVLLPSLPDTSRLLLAGRDEPVSAWAGELGELFEPLPLANLRREDAEELLQRAGVAPADAVRIDRIARGHPLSLRLSAAALANRPDLDLESLATGAVVDELTRIYLAGLDRETRRALDAASVVRRPTRALLAAMLDEDDADLSLERLQRLPFVESDPDGLVLHDTIREAVAASLKATDLVRYRRYRVAAWQILRRELAEAGRNDLWRATADALYMLEQPILRESFFPTPQRTHLLEPARADDGPGISAIARRHESRDAARLIETWWQHAPTSFRVARGRAGGVDAYVCVCDPDALPHPLAAGDPATALIREDLRRNPIGRGRRALAIRSMLAGDTGEASPPHRPPAGSTSSASTLRSALHCDASTPSSPRSSSTARRSSRSGSSPCTTAPSTSEASPTTCSPWISGPRPSTAGSAGSSRASSSSRTSCSTSGSARS